jgi:hypothetical protein
LFTENTEINLLDACSGTVLATEEYCDQYKFQTFINYDNVSAGSIYILEFGSAHRFNCAVTDTFDFTFTSVGINYDELSICDGDSIFLGGSWQNAPGVYQDTLSDVSGNDSIVATTLTLNPVYDIVEDVVICIGGTYTLPDGTVVNTAGTYISDLFTFYACDSIITTNLTTISEYNVTENISICNSETYILPNGTEVSTGGTYVSNLISGSGCDSIVTTNLIINQTYNLNEDVVLCSGETYVLPNGSEVSAEGSYISNLSTVEGCDSIITTNLAVNPSYVISENVSICAGSIYILPNGNKVNTAGTYISKFFTVEGCDSIITTNLSINPSYKINVNVSICEGNTYALPDGIEVSAEGIYTSNLLTKEGCDSVIVTNVNINQADVINLSEAICDGESIQIGENVFTETGNYIVHLYNEFGCDSIINLDLTVNLGDVTYLYDTICEGESVQLAYVILTKSGLYGVTLTNQFGCDSLVYLDLYVNSVDINLGSDATIQLNDTIILDAGEGFETYYWSTGETSQTILFEGSVGIGSYSFNVLATDNIGCTGSDTINITIEEITDIISTNSLVKNIKVYPNPTSGIINIQLPESNTPVEICIFDVIGKLIMKNEVAINETSFTTELPDESGLYFIQVKSNSKVSTFKIIKK